MSINLSPGDNVRFVNPEVNPGNLTVIDKDKGHSKVPTIEVLDGLIFRSGGRQGRLVKLAFLASTGDEKALKEASDLIERLGITIRGGLPRFEVLVERGTPEQGAIVTFRPPGAVEEISIPLYQLIKHYEAFITTLPQFRIPTDAVSIGKLIEGQLTATNSSSTLNHIVRVLSTVFDLSATYGKSGKTSGEVPVTTPGTSHHAAGANAGGNSGGSSNLGSTGEKVPSEPISWFKVEPPVRQLPESVVQLNKILASDIQDERDLANNNPVISYKSTSSGGYILEIRTDVGIIRADQIGLSSLVRSYVGGHGVSEDGVKVHQLLGKNNVLATAPEARAILQSIEDQLKKYGSSATLSRVIEGLNVGHRLDTVEKPVGSRGQWDLILRGESGIFRLPSSPHTPP